MCCDISGSLTDQSIFSWHTILAAILKALCSRHHLSISARNEGRGVTSIMGLFWMDLDYRFGDREWCWPSLVFLAAVVQFGRSHFLSCW